MLRVKKRVFLYVSCLLSVFLSAEGFSSGASEKQTQKGYQFLTQRQFDQALKSFQAASKVNPTDVEALFFQGVALNRLGRFAQAAEKLDEAKKGGTHPEWNFERGWAHLGLQEWQKAISSLRAYDKKHPGRGQTSEFIGRAYFELGEREKAEKYLKKALKQNGDLKETVGYYLSAISASPPGQKTKKPKNWNIYSNVSGSYNTNAINLGNSATRPTNISRQESGLTNTVLGGSYRFDLSDTSQLSLGTQAFSNFYEVSSRLSLFDNYTFLRFRHAFDPKKVLGITVSNDFSIVQTAKFRNQIGFQPVFRWRLADWLVSELGYAFAYGKYFFPSNAAQRRTGSSHTISLSNYFAVPKTKLRLRLGGSHLWNRANGADFVYQGHGLNFAISNPLFWKVTGELFFSQTWNRYSNVNSLTAGTKRSDDVSNIFAQFNYPIIGKLNGFLRGGYTRNGSNIAVFNYRACQGSLGFLAAF